VLVPLCGKSVDMTYLASCGHRVYGIEISTEAIEAFFDDAGLPRSVDDADAHARPRARLSGAGSGLESRGGSSPSLSSNETSTSSNN
jgi:hypothetical protein